MSCSESNNNIPTPTTTAVTPITTEIEIVIDQETQKLFKAEENIPAVCEESKRLTQILQNRRNSALTIIRVAAVLSVIAITLITTIVAVCSGDTSKLSAATLYNIAQTLALHSNGTSNTSKPVF
jgi:sensor histidine kinase YesM